MRKQAGFSLIELVVAMAVLALIMGAMIHLFGSSTVSLHTGAKQEVVYEEARLLMNELKTTLRYADKDSIDPEKPTFGTNELTYNGSIWDRHMDISQGRNKDYKITVEWKDDTKKQLQVTYENITDSTKKVTVFPKDIKNSVFEGNFPITAESITLNDSNTVIIYKIALPVQYELNGEMKTQTLETKVVPSKDEISETIEEKILKEYTNLVSIRHKITNGNVLTSLERKLLDDFKSFFGQSSDTLWQLGKNDRIREYLLKEKYTGTWPSVDINGETVYMNPYGYDNNNDPITIDNIFLIGYTNPQQATGWNVNYVYNPENKQWYYTKKGESVNKPLNEVKEMLNKPNWQIVTKN